MTAPATLPPPDDIETWVEGQTRAGILQLIDEMSLDELRKIARYVYTYAPDTLGPALADRLRCRRDGNRARTAKRATA